MQRFVNILTVFYISNIVLLRDMIPMHFLLFLIFTVLFVRLNVMPCFRKPDIHSKRLMICASGGELLLIFAGSLFFTFVFSLYGLYGFFVEERITIGQILLQILVAFLMEAIVFWNGIIRIYLTSEQLGIRYRVIGILLGWILPVNLIMLGKIVAVTRKEVKVENEKILLNESRQEQKICATKYPILLVHGVFFRDFRYLNYWGRIPKELEKNGAVLFYGNQQSADSVENCGRELAKRILSICEECHCDKVNIIAHSKGGLDSRYALSLEGIASHVASLTTINTPHRGCEFADYLLSKIPEKQKSAIATAYNKTLKKIGDPNPDFLKAVADLTYEKCNARNEVITDADGVYYQSVGSKLSHAYGGRFPLNLSYLLVDYFDGPNDGLVGEKSCRWGNEFEFLSTDGKRGISHGDMIDLNRENLDGFDVREFYVQLVAKLKQNGF